MKDEIFNMTRAWNKEKSEFPTGIEPMTSRTPGGLITTHDEFGSADPSSMQDTCHILPWSQRLSFILYWQIFRREPLLLFFLSSVSAESREKKASGRDRWESHFHAISF